ncbi:hypothetical protein GJ496_011380 [Pomphorhynchus laevis]|nr:hypothetical protein GJ496_011380 [Pomphorhynchus laevis]
MKSIVMSEPSSPHQYELRYGVNDLEKEVTRLKQIWKNLHHKNMLRVEEEQYQTQLLSTNFKPNEEFKINLNSSEYEHTTRVEKSNIALDILIQREC